MVDSILPLQIESQRGVTREQAIELLEDVRKVAAKYPEIVKRLTERCETLRSAGRSR